MEFDVKEVSDYIEQLNQGRRDEDLTRIYQYALDNKIPAMRPDTAVLLTFLLKLQKPNSILEIGTGSGFSTLNILKACPKSKVITLERDKNRYISALKLFENESNIQVYNLDAINFFKDNKLTFDAVILDCQKRDYIELLPFILNCLKTGGFLFSDNILLGNRVAKKLNDNDKHLRKTIENLQGFNSEIASHPQLETLFLGLDDGVAVSIKKEML